MEYNIRDMHDQCMRFKFYHVILTMHDGSTMDGIIEDVDGENVTALMGEDVMEDDTDDMRQYYGGFGGYERPRRRYRRFRRRRFPLALLAGLTLLPYAFSYPYYPFF